MKRDMEEKPGTSSLLIGLVVLLVFSVPVAMWFAFVALKLYGWFAIPLGAPVIEFWQAMGLMCLISLLKFKGNAEHQNTKTGAGHAIGFVVGWFLSASIVLAMGFLYFSLWK